MKLFTSLNMDASALLRTVLAVLVPVTFILASPYFLTSGNLFALMQSFALVGLVALGLSLTMMAGEFDLSVASMVAVGGLILAKTGVESAITGVALAMGFGLLVGIVNALIVIRLKVSSLISSLGMMILLSGYAYWLADGKVVPYFNFDASDVLDSQMLWVLSPRILVTVMAFIVIWAFLSFTRLGRDLYATGSNRKAALMSGAKTSSSLFMAFCCSSVFAALAGALLSISLATGSPSLGEGLLIQAASAAILGGVSLSGGAGKASGIAAGTLILVALNNGLSLMGVSSPVSLLVNGLVLALVVLINGEMSQSFFRSFKKVSA